MMMQGYNLEDVTPGVDEMQIRQPLGVVAAIVPFNFPAMIAYWFLPYAIACGNTFIIKPSERVPLSLCRAFELLEKTGLPKGVVNLVNGGKEVVNALCDHPQVRAISFVGSTPVAKHVYTRSAASGKRAQCQGGAKNHVIVLPDADMELATQIISDSAFGCAGQRCLAVSVAVTIGEAQKTFRDSIAHAASHIRVGNGLDSGVQMGPVISPDSKHRIESLITAGVGEGAKAILDGRKTKIPNHESGNFVTPTVLDGLPASSQLANTEIFGPVLSLVHANSIDEAMDFLRRSPYGNQASLFTTKRLRRPQIPLRSSRRQHRHQHRRRRAYGVFPLQRLEREFLWHPSRPGPRRRRIFHRIQNRSRALVPPGNPQVLSGTDFSLCSSFLHDHSTHQSRRP